MRRVVVIALAFGLLGGVTAGIAWAGKPLYRTDQEAEVFLEHGLRTWAHIDLRKAHLKSAFCVNGYGSPWEERFGEHYPQGREDRDGEAVFRSFACTLVVHVTSWRTFSLYLVTTGTGWRVLPDP